MTLTRPSSVKLWLTSPLILVAGASVYALAEGPGKVTFYITPLTVGVVAVIAGAVGSHRHLLPAGLGIAGWGLAVALVNYHVIPASKTTPAYMIGIGAGVLATSYIAPRLHRAAWTHSAAVAAVAAGFGYFMAFGLPSLGRWQAWAITLVVWAAWETLQPLVRPSPALAFTAQSESDRPSQGAKSEQDHPVSQSRLK